MVLNAKLKLTVEEYTELQRIARAKGESLPALLDRCFQDAIAGEIRESQMNTGRIAEHEGSQEMRDLRERLCGTYSSQRILQQGVPEEGK